MEDDPAPGSMSARVLRVRLAEGVVHRSFGDQLVLLNLETGQYHGLNPTARRMFELMLERNGTAGVARAVAEEYGRAESDVEDDLVQLCRALAERDLVELDPIL